MSQYSGQSATNQDAADGGYWHQRLLIESIRRWRQSPLGARLVLSLFGSDALSALGAGAEPMQDPSAKPDLMVWLTLANENRLERFVSAKLARVGSTDSADRPMHHAARVKFEDADRHGMLPADDLEIRSALLSHFIDGEALAFQDPELSMRAMAFLRSGWPLVARSAIEGIDQPKADFVAISKALPQSDGTLQLVETRLISSIEAIRALLADPPKMSSPKEGQVGTLGSRLLHIQRGQAQSLGHQRDIQIKINAGALFALAPPLPPLP
jgi:hypothetical protein